MGKEHQQKPLDNKSWCGIIDYLPFITTSGSIFYLSSVGSIVPLAI